MGAERVRVRSAETAKVLAEMAADQRILRHEFRTGVMGRESQVPWAAKAAKAYDAMKAARKAKREKEYADDTYGGKRHF